MCRCNPGHKGGLNNPCPGVENAEPVIVILGGLPCLERGHHKKWLTNGALEALEAKLGEITKVSIMHSRILRQG